MKSSIKRVPKYDLHRAFAILEKEIPNYRYPPTEQNRETVISIARRAQLTQLAAITCLLALAAFGIYYVFDENKAIHLLIHLTLYALPCVGIVAIVALLHFRERDICARTLLTTWNEWSAHRDKSDDAKISN